jgi:aspartokinase/homoserine dehydrogenase 1
MGIPAGGEQGTTSSEEQNRLPNLDCSILKPAGILPEHALRPVLERRRGERPRKKPLHVLKFGGTSVADASCITRVVDIIRTELRESYVVAVISAMSGVTNQLVAAAKASESGDRKSLARIFEELRAKHEAVASILIHSAKAQEQIARTMKDVFREGDRLCRGTILLRELTPRALDSISGLGERLSAPLVAAALAERGVESKAIDATELVVTDSSHGAAEPLMDLTHERCKARIRPLLFEGTVPVVTGFIGATSEGIATTLGRNGSDYSATILGAALDADEIVIWSDVDGVLTVDPRLVPGVSTIPEISYREAAELAYFGAQVLHPKTLRPVMKSGTPIWIRNTFAPEGRGTRITPSGCPNVGGVKAVTAVSDVALITVGGPGMVGVRDVLSRTFKATSAVQADVLLVLQSSSQNDVCFIVTTAAAKRTIEALQREFAKDLAREQVEHITLNPDVAIVAVVGEKVHGTPGIAARTSCALSRDNVNIIAIAQGSSETNISFLVPKKDMRAALIATHREFLGQLPCGASSASGV